MPDGKEPVVEPTLESLHADVKAQSTLLRELATTLAQLMARERVVDDEGAHCSGSGQRITGQPTGSGGAAERPDLLELAQSGRVGAKSVSHEDDYLAVPELLQRAEYGYEAVRPVSRVPGFFPMSTDLTNEYLKQDHRRLPAQEEYLWMSCFGAHMAALFVALDELLPYVLAASQDFTPYLARARNRAEAIDKAFRFRLAFLRRLNERRQLQGAGVDEDVVVDADVAAKVSTSDGVGRLSSELMELCDATFRRRTSSSQLRLRHGAARTAGAGAWPVAPTRHIGSTRTCARRDPKPDLALLLLHPTSAKALAGPLQAVGAPFREALAWLPPGTTAAELAQWADVLWGSAHLRAIDPYTAAAAAPPLPRLLRGAEALTAEVVLLVWGDDAGWLGPATTQAVLQAFHADPALGMLSLRGERHAEPADGAEAACGGAPASPPLLFRAAGEGQLAVRRAALLDALRCMDGCGAVAAALSEAMWAAGWAVAARRVPGLPPSLPPPAALHPTCPSLPSGAAQRTAAACAAFRQRQHAGKGRPPTAGPPQDRAAPCDAEGRAAGGCPLAVAAADSPRWTIVVQYYRQAGFISRLLAGLQAVVRAAGTAPEVIVMNDGASELEPWLAGLAALKGVSRTLLVASNNLHEIRAYNAAARLAAGELLALLQDDDDPGADPGWLAAAGGLLAAHPRMALLGGHRGRLDCAPDGGEVPMDVKRKMAEGMKFGPGHTPIPTLDPTTRIPFMFAYKVNAAPLIVRRSVLLELGGLHRELSCPGEAGIGFDFELSARMWAEGHQVGLFYSNFDRVAHGNPDGNRDGSGVKAKDDHGKLKAKGKPALVSGTRANKSAHKVRIANYHANNAALYVLYPHTHHRNGTMMAVEACKKLLMAPSRADPRLSALLSPSRPMR
eukprot:jgi/Tetstr1/465295/TSEL_009993.t1